MSPLHLGLPARTGALSALHPAGYYLLPGRECPEAPDRWPYVGSSWDIAGALAVGAEGGAPHAERMCRQEGRFGEGFGQELRGGLSQWWHWLVGDSSLPDKRSRIMLAGTVVVVLVLVFGLVATLRSPARSPRPTTPTPPRPPLPSPSVLVRQFRMPRHGDSGSGFGCSARHHHGDGHRPPPASPHLIGPRLYPCGQRKAARVAARPRPARDHTSSTTTSATTTTTRHRPAADSDPLR